MNLEMDLDEATNKATTQGVLICQWELSEKVQNGVVPAQLCEQPFGGDSGPIS